FPLTLYSYTPHCLSFFFTAPATSQTSTLSLHDALPISAFMRPSPTSTGNGGRNSRTKARIFVSLTSSEIAAIANGRFAKSRSDRDRKSTRLNSSHGSISYAVFCLKKKKKKIYEHNKKEK